jgi:hypothetical protein
MTTDVIRVGPSLQALLYRETRLGSEVLRKRTQGVRTRVVGARTYISR